MEKQAPLPSQLRLVLVRGISGSGKSTLTRSLLMNEYNTSDFDRHIFSTDDFFVDPITGEYHFNFPSLNKAHLWNQVRAELAMEKHVNPVIIDNTNLQAWEAKPYYELSLVHGYELDIIEPTTAWKFDSKELTRKNKHGLTEPNIIKLIERYEPYTVEDIPKAKLDSNFVLLSEAEIKKEKAKWRAKLTESESQSAKGSVSSVQERRNMVIEVTKNDGQKEMFKPLVIKISHSFEDVKKQACDTLNLRFSKQCKLFTLVGAELSSLSELEAGIKLCVSHQGAAFIPMALRRTAEERREIKQKMLMQNNTNSTANPAAKKKKKTQITNIDKLPLGISTIIQDLLYLGSARDAHSLTELRREGITCIVNVAGQDCPCPPQLDGIEYHQVDVADEESEDISAHFGEVCDIIERVKMSKDAAQCGEATNTASSTTTKPNPNARVLVQCVVGKSRSATMVIAYLMRHRGVNLRDAYNHVRSRREFIVPNRGFLAQLMREEARLFPDVPRTLGWHEVRTGAKCLSHWLTENAQTGPASHIWWEVISKRKFSVPDSAMEELVGEHAKAIYRWRRTVEGRMENEPASSTTYSVWLPRTEYTVEPLKLVELVNTQRKYKLMIDVDIKLATGEWELEPMIPVLLNLLLPLLHQWFPSGQNQEAIDARSLLSHLDLLPAFYDCAVTGVMDKYHVSSVSQAKYKLGYHFCFPNIHVSLESHKQFLQAIIQEFENKRHELEILNPMFVEINAHNQYNEVFDVNLFNHPEHIEIRMLYTMKSFSCHLCQKNDQNKAKQKKAQKRKEKNGREKYVEPECEQCSGTGMLPFRIHNFIGTWRESISEEDEKSSKGFVKCTDACLVDGSVQSYFKQLVLTRVNIPFAQSAKLEAQAPTNSDIGEIRGELKEDICQQYIVVRETVDQSESQRLMLQAIEKAREAAWDRPELQVVQFLQKHSGNGSPAQALCDQYGLKSSLHEKHRNLVQFSYSQRGSDMSLPLVRECRGLVLNAKAQWKPVCLPYYKFFNHGESNAPKLDWSKVTVTEKVDGSIACLYWFEDEWHVASSSTPDGAAKLSITGGREATTSFEELFWDIWRNHEQYTLPENKQLTYIFEMFTRRHPIVVRVQDEELILHGVRDLVSYSEIDPVVVANAYGWRVAPSFAFSSLDEIMQTCKKLDPTKHEGFVVCDRDWNRVKIKCPQYVALAHLSISNKKEINGLHLLHVIRANEADEFLCHFPEFSEQYTSLKQAFQTLQQKLEASDPEQDKFLEKYQRSECKSVLEFLQECNINDLQAAIDKILNGKVLTTREKELLAIQAKKAKKQKKLDQVQQRKKGREENSQEET